MWDDFQARLDALDQQSRLRKLTARSASRVSLSLADGTPLLNFGSNDYLGLAHQPVPGNHAVEQSAKRLADSDACQAGSTASALVCGWTEHHQTLADKIAALEGTQSAVVFPTGFAACMGTIATLCGPKDLILSDQLNHASLIDGCRLSRAQCVVYPHRDVDFIDDHLTQHRQAYQRVWIVSDAVFSMDGHLAPLPQLVQISKTHDADLIVDEAHGTGVLGDHLSGACEALGVKDSVHIRIGTLSKALGGQGGFVVCPQIVADYLVNHCRTLIYSTALNLPAVHAAIAAVDSLPDCQQRRQHVCGLAAQFRRFLAETRWSPAAQLATTLPEGGSGTESITALETGVPIIPIMTGSDVATIAAAESMRSLGLYVPAIRPPTVPEGQGRLRVSLSALHSQADLQRLIDAVKPL